MNSQEFAELQNLCNVMAQLKKQIIEDLPHYGSESLYFHNDEITTGLMNNKFEIKLHMIEKKLLFFHNEKGIFIDILEEGISEKISKITQKYDLKMSEIDLKPIPEKSLENFYEFAFNANQVLERFRMKISGIFTMVHLWPHHFDFSVEWFTGENDEQIGTGISPGDEQYSEPYLYMNPWPFNKKIIEEKLPFGKWNTDGWNGIKVDFESLIQLGPEKASDDIYKLFEIAKRNYAMN